MVEYYRHPIHLGMNPADDDKLDNTYEVQAALPYYVAAHLAMLDDAFAYQALYNEFESRLSRLTEMPQTEFNTIEDVYDRCGCTSWRQAVTAGVCESIEPAVQTEGVCN